MEECDICGRKAGNLYLVEIEGAQMVACAECSKGAKIIDQLRTTEQVQQARRPEKQAEESTIVENYGKIIRDARESLGIPIKVLAEKLNETESDLKRVESQHTLPRDKLAKKLEKELGIKLIVKEDAKTSQRAYGKADQVTLGDAAVFKDKKQGV
ncbi:MAG: TIGR00270 family protein [Candidatus Micrarchaeota archaeon]|nr:TIGR00270 family protein [Candidatus Micrarchaeota archaeon]MDE1834803.1 TIGR00270 family protein [Candidatus Micrarchaeota archaeon]MDE1859583.1 TIGR00270 family protein [Candidatus Micrarchaeota archaeon]